MQLRFWSLLVAAGVAGFACPKPAEAHPHVWIEMRSDVVFNDAGLITGFNVEWTFDENYAAMALDGLDINGDGVYGQDELAPLTQENMKSLVEYNYFTVIRANGELQKTGAATQVGQIWSNNKLMLHFQVPLETPVDPRKAEVMVKVYDPDFFIAIDYAKESPVNTVGAMPDACKLFVKPVPTDAELEQTRLMLAEKTADWKPENNEDFGALFAQPVSVACSA